MYADSSSWGLLAASGPPPPRCRPAIPGQPAAASPTAPRSWAGQEAGTAAGWAGATWLGRLLAGTRTAPSRRVGFPSLCPVTLSGFPPTLSVGLSRKSPCLFPPSSALPFLGMSPELRNTVSRPSRDSKRSFVFPRGQQPNASLVFRNKADIQWGGGRHRVSPLSEALRTPAGSEHWLQGPGGLGVGWGGVGAVFPRARPQKPDPGTRGNWVFG